MSKEPALSDAEVERRIAVLTEYAARRNGIACVHGSLARSCETCDAYTECVDHLRELQRARAEAARLRERWAKAQRVLEYLGWKEP